MDQQAVSDLCAAFQTAIGDVIEDRMKRALDRYRTRFPDSPARLVAAGGVAANRSLRARLQAVADAGASTLIVPPPRLCTDNAAMIAWAGAERLAAGQEDGLDISPRSRWPLDGSARPVLGHGKHGTKV